MRRNESTINTKAVETYYKTVDSATAIKTIIKQLKKLKSKETRKENKEYYTSSIKQLTQILKSLA